MIARRSFLGLLAGLPFVGNALADSTKAMAWSDAGYHRSNLVRYVAKPEEMFVEWSDASDFNSWRGLLDSGMFANFPGGPLAIRQEMN